MDVGMARNRATGASEGTVGNVDKNIGMRTDEVAEERDLVGVYLHEISRTPLLDAAKEVDLSKAIEAGLYAEHLLGEDARSRRCRPGRPGAAGRRGRAGEGPLHPGQPAAGRVDRPPLRALRACPCWT